MAAACHNQELYQRGLVCVNTANLQRKSLLKVEALDLAATASDGFWRTLIAVTVLLINALREWRERRDTVLREARHLDSRDYATFSGRPAFDSSGQWRRGLLPAALVVIGLTMVVFADFTGDHRVGAGGVAIVGAAIMMAIAGWLMRRPDGAAQFALRDWASYLTQTSEQGLLFVRSDQPALYECAVRAFGADRSDSARACSRLTSLIVRKAWRATKAAAQRPAGVVAIDKPLCYSG